MHMHCTKTSVTVNGIPGLMRELSKKFDFAGSDGVKFTGVSVDGMCIHVPRNTANERHILLRMHCIETGDVFETCGYGTNLFFDSIGQKDCLVEIAGVRTARQRLNRRIPRNHQYVLEFRAVW